MSATVDNYGNYLALGGVDQPALLPPQVGFVTVGAGNPNTLGIISIVYPALFYDTSTNTVYGTTDGSTWTAIVGGGGGGTTQVYTGNGAPVSVPTNPAVYYNQVDGDFYVWYTGSAAWEKLIDF